MTTAQTSTSATASVDSGIKETARQLKEEGRGLAHDLRGHAEEYAQAQKAQVARRVSTLAETLRDTSGKLRQRDETAVASLTGSAADQLDRVSRSLREKDVGTMFAEASDLARSHPAIFLGGTVALGFIAGRFLRASGERIHEQDDTFGAPSSM